MEVLPMLQTGSPGKMKMGTGKNIYFYHNPIQKSV